jgi:hypothetical protein
MSVENTQEQNSVPEEVKKPTPAPKKTVFKAFTAAQANHTMKFAYYGGMQNIAFQVGEIVRKNGDSPNKVYLRTGGKSDRYLLPIILPNGLKAPPNGRLVKITSTVMGAKDAFGRRYPMLVARHIDSPNIFEANARSIVEYLSKEQEEGFDATQNLRKGSVNNNELSFVGIFSAAQQIQKPPRPDGSVDDSAAIVFYARVDADKDHLIPVFCDKKLAENAKDRIKYGYPLSFKGVYEVHPIKALKLGEDGKPIKDESGKTVPLLNDAGEQVVHFQPIIKLTKYPAPADASQMLFPESQPTPGWIKDIAVEIEARRSKARVQAPEKSPQEIRQQPDDDGQQEGVATLATVSNTELEGNLDERVNKY